MADLEGKETKERIERAHAGGMEGKNRKIMERSKEKERTGRSEEREREREREILWKSLSVVEAKAKETSTLIIYGLSSPTQTHTCISTH